MQNFSDFLPEETRAQIAADNFKIGAVLKYHMPFTNPPKEKIAVVVGLDTHKVLFAVVLINSAINLNIFRTPELQFE